MTLSCPSCGEKNTRSAIMKQLQRSKMSCANCAAIFDTQTGALVSAGSTLVSTSSALQSNSARALNQRPQRVANGEYIPAQASLFNSDLNDRNVRLGHASQNRAGKQSTPVRPAARGSYRQREATTISATPERIDASALTDNPFRRAIKELEHDTSASECWALDLLAAEESIFLRHRERRAALQRSNIQITRNATSQSKDKNRMVPPNDPATGLQELDVQDALQEFHVEDAWALELLEEADRMTVCQLLIMDTLEEKAAL